MEKFVVYNKYAWRKEVILSQTLGLVDKILYAKILFSDSDVIEVQFEHDRRQYKLNIEVRDSDLDF